MTTGRLTPPLTVFSTHLSGRVDALVTRVLHFGTHLGHAGCDGLNGEGEVGLCTEGLI